MKRSAHMVDLLRPTLNLENQVQLLKGKSEITLDDLNKIIENAKMMKKAAKIAKKERYGE